MRNAKLCFSISVLAIMLPFFSCVLAHAAIAAGDIEPGILANNRSSVQIQIIVDGTNTKWALNNRQESKLQVLDHLAAILSDGFQEPIEVIVSPRLPVGDWLRIHSELSSHFKAAKFVFLTELPNNPGGGLAEIATIGERDR